MRRSRSKPLSPCRERLIVFGALVGFALLVLVGIHVASTVKFQTSMQAELRHLKQEYDLSDGEVERIRAMEREFHGSGSPFTSPFHSPEEIREHKGELAKMLAPGRQPEILERLER